MILCSFFILLTFLLFFFKASYLMDFTKKQAIEYWKYWHFKDQNIVLEKTGHSLVKQDSSNDIIILSSDDDKTELVKKEQNIMFQESHETLPKVMESKTSSKPTTVSLVPESSSSVSFGKTTSNKSDKKETEIILNAQVDIHVKDNYNNNSSTKDPTDLDINKYKNYLSSKNNAENQTTDKEEVTTIEDAKSMTEFDGKREKYQTAKRFFKFYILLAWNNTSVILNWVWSYLEVFIYCSFVVVLCFCFIIS